MTAAERAYAEARDQGLPERIEDSATLARLAVLLAAPGDEGGKRGR